MKTNFFEKISVRKFVLLCVIAVLIVILVCQLAISGANDGYNLKLKDGFDRLTIKKGSEPTILFDKNGEDWFVCQLENENETVISEKSKADTNTMTRMQDFFAKISVVGVVSRTNDDERFGFGESSIFLTATKNGKVVRKIEIGKASATGQQVYCRIDGKNEVVLVSGGIRQLFERDFERFKM